MSAQELTSFERGPVVDGQRIFDQERLERDFGLTQRVQAGYTPAEATEELPYPRIVDGNLTGDAMAALDELWSHYKNMAIGVARKLEPVLFDKPGIDVDDLITEGFFGVYHSAVKWSPAKQITFLTHARGSVKSHMDRRIAASGYTIALPTNVRQQVNQANSVFWGIYGHQEHAPRRDQVAKSMGITPRQADNLFAFRGLTNELGSLDRGFFEDGRDRHSVFDKYKAAKMKPIDPEATVQNAVDAEVIIKEICAIVNETLDESGGLNYNLVQILKLRFLGEERLTLEEVGRHLGIGKGRVRQLEVRALAILRHPENSKRLRGLLS